MPYRIRVWGDRDADSPLRISRAVYPEYREDPLHPAWFPARQLGMPRDPARRYVAVDVRTDEAVAYAALWELRPGRYRFDLAVQPDWQRQGIGNQLVSRVIAGAGELGGTAVQSRVRDDRTADLCFVQRRGFEEVHRMGAYRLEFAAPALPLPDALGRLHDAGIDVTTLAAVRTEDPRYLARFHELYSAAREDWPDPDPDPAGTVDVPPQRLKVWLDEVKLPEALYIARRSGRFVGFSSLFAMGTAVHPGDRGKGIATHLKAVSVAAATGRGFRGQTTGTASPAMKAVLLKLGYRPLWSEIRLLRSLA